MTDTTTRVAPALTAGNRQPLEARWNVGGYANNAVHRVSVTVPDS